MSEEREHKTLAPSDMTSVVDAHTPPETLRLAEAAGIAKARLGWTDLIVKSFLAGVFISLGAGFDILIAGGSPGLRQSNPSMATLISALTFPVGFVIIMLTNTELCTSNMFIIPRSDDERACTTWRETGSSVMLPISLGVYFTPDACSTGLVCSPRKRRQATPSHRLKDVSMSTGDTMFQRASCAIGLFRLHSSFPPKVATTCPRSLVSGLLLRASWPWATSIALPTSFWFQLECFMERTLELESSFGRV
jgi:hypothetical protein